MKCTRKNKLFKATPKRTQVVKSNKKSSGKKIVELENIDD